MNHGDNMIANYFKNRVSVNEEKVSKHINVIGHYDDSTLIDKSGKLIKILKLSGVNYVTQSAELLDLYKNRFNNILKSFSSEFALYFWNVRRKVNQFSVDEFINPFARELNEKYINKLQHSDMFHIELYLAVITKQPEGFISKGYSLFQQFNFNVDKNAKDNYLKKRHHELNNVINKLMSSLKDYDCELLSVYQKDNQLYSKPLEILSKLVNYDESTVPLHKHDAASVLARKRLFFNKKAGLIEIRAADSKSKFAGILSIKDYSPRTYQGILNELNVIRCDYTLTQSYRFYDRQDAKKKMRDKQHEMGQSKDESVSQTEQIDEMFDDAASGEVGYGKHHLTLTCFADSIDELNTHIGVITAKFANADITVVREDVACELGFWAQLPGNFGYIARAADISTRNISGFASCHNDITGKATGNHWGNAVTVLETISGSPYFFNFHYKDVGNFLVYGAMGSGKTLLVGFLIAQSMKFGGKRIIFDKDRGLEIVVRAIGGIYDRIKPGIPTGFNPCHLADTPENRQFLLALFKKMLTMNGEVLLEHEVEMVLHAIEGLYRFEDKSLRQLCHLATFFGAKKKGSIRARFDQWHSDGAYAWLFDNEEDQLNLNADVIGFDLGSLLSHPAKTPALMYLTYRIEQALEGVRGIIFFDEGWLALADDYFKNFINNNSRISRKKNIIFGLATQIANDTINLPNSKAINESAFTKIFFANPSADQHVYIDELGLTPYEYHLVKTLPDDLFYFLLVHGHGINKQSVIARVNLAGMQNEIAVISGREETVLLLDDLRNEVGDDPIRWLPKFHELAPQALSSKASNNEMRLAQKEVLQ